MKTGEKAKNGVDARKKRLKERFLQHLLTAEQPVGERPDWHHLGG
jgi:hypothetical protein